MGFPGESQEDFSQLAEALTTLPVTYHHIFRYSERRGTVAAALAESVDPAERKRRGRILAEISRKRRESASRV